MDWRRIAGGLRAGGKRARLLPWLAMLCLPLVVWAGDEPVHYDRVSLSASASGRVDNDTIIASLYAQEEGSETALLADRVNQRIRWGVEQVKQHDELKVQTQSYNTYPIYDKGRVTGWRVRQSFRIESRNMALVSKLLGTLQSRLALESISFGVSPKQRQQSENGLIEDALAAFERRAKLIARSLHKSGYRIVRINVNTSGGGYHPQPRMMMAKSAAMADVAPPSVEAGESRLTVSVNGEIELQ